jgi:hypothetical protein
VRRKYRLHSPGNRSQLPVLFIFLITSDARAETKVVLRYQDGCRAMGDSPQHCTHGEGVAPKHRTKEYEFPKGAVDKKQAPDYVQFEDTSRGNEDLLRDKNVVRPKPFLRHRAKSQVADFPSLMEKPQFGALPWLSLLTTKDVKIYQYRWEFLRLAGFKSHPLRHFCKLLYLVTLIFLVAVLVAAM